MTLLQVLVSTFMSSVRTAIPSDLCHLIITFFARYRNLHPARKRLVSFLFGRCSDHTQSQFGGRARWGKTFGPYAVRLHEMSSETDRSPSDLCRMLMVTATAPTLRE